MNINKSLTLIAAGVLALAPTTQALNILVFDTNTTNSNAQAALVNLGLSYTVGGAGDFNTLLTNGTVWDLLVLDIPSTVPSTGFGDIINFVDGGGKAILSYWDLDTVPALATAFDVTVDTTLGPPTSVYAWDSGHAVWDGLTSPVSGFDDIWGDDGDRFELSGATMLGGFTASPTAGQGAIGLGNGGRTIANGFLFDELNDANGIGLIENEIDFLLNGSSPSVPDGGSTALLLGMALLGAPLARRKLLAR